MMTVASLNGFILLPDADLNDVELLDVSVISRRAMNGTRYTHKRSSGRKKYTYVFSSLQRYKMFELQTFLKLNKAATVTITDWEGNIATGIFDEGVDSFTTARRSAGGGLRNEAGSVTIVFIGE